MDKIELVNKIDLFATLSDVDRALISTGAHQRSLATGDVVCREGEQGRTFYAVGKGSLAVRRGTPERDVTVLRAGEYFGEMSLLTGEPRTATIVALEPTQVLEFSRPVFMDLFARNVEIARVISEAVSTRQIALQKFAGAVAQPEAPSDIFGRIRHIFGF